MLVLYKIPTTPGTVHKDSSRAVQALYFFCGINFHGHLAYCFSIACRISLTCIATSKGGGPINIKMIITSTFLKYNVLHLTCSEHSGHRLRILLCYQIQTATTYLFFNRGTTY
jgi:hypothetical protein